MDQFSSIAGFIATGSAWGLVWLGIVGLLHKDVTISAQAGLVGLAFAFTGSIFAIFQFYGLYDQYSTSSEIMQRLMREQYTGEHWWAHWGKIAITALPILFWVRRLRVSRAFIAIAGLCYVLLAYYDMIVRQFI